DRHSRPSALGRRGCPSAPQPGCASRVDRFGRYDGDVPSPRRRAHRHGASPPGSASVSVRIDPGISAGLLLQGGRAMNASDRLVNLVGALALGVTDEMRAAVAEAMPQGGETVSAVIVIGHAPAMSIDQLSRILRLTHGGAVRLVDRLV